MACIVTYVATLREGQQVLTRESCMLPIGHCESVPNARAEAHAKLGEVWRAGFEITDVWLEWRDANTALKLW